MIVHDPIQVSGEVLLRYGMLEGDAIIEAHTAVYDPQSGCDNEYWPTCADEYWPTPRCLIC